MLTCAFMRTGLEFAPGTTDDCKRQIGMLLKPQDILEAYRAARQQFGSTDIVLATSDQVGHIEYTTRLTYCEHLKGLFGKKAAGFKMWSHSAHSIMKLPNESEAMWLVVQIQGSDLPIMCVIYATPYEISAAN